MFNKYLVIVTILLCIQHIQSQKYLEDYNPIDQLGRGALKENWPLDKGDYLRIVHYGIQSIPVVGGIADCFFNIIWDKFYPPPKLEDKFVTKVDFEKRMKTLYQDMKQYTDKSITDEMLKNAKLRYQNLLESSKKFITYENIFTEEKKNNSGNVSSDTKNGILVIYFQMEDKLNDAMNHYSHPSNLPHTGKLFIETAILKMAFLRDLKYYGIEFGIPKHEVNGFHDKLSTVEKKISQHSKRSLQVYHEFMFKMSKIEKMVEKQVPSPFGGSMKINTKGFIIPKWATLMSELFYSDVTLYPKNKKWLKPITSSPDMISRFEVPATRQTYIIDAIELNTEVAKYKSQEFYYTFLFDPFEQSVDFVTGARGFIYNTKNNYYHDFHVDFKEYHDDGVFYTSIKLDDSKNLFFRLYSLISDIESQRFDVQFIELDESKANGQSISFSSISTFTQKELPKESFSSKDFVDVFKPAIPFQKILSSDQWGTSDGFKNHFGFAKRGYVKTKTYSFNSKIIVIKITPIGKNVNCNLLTLELNYN